MKSLYIIIFLVLQVYSGFSQGSWAPLNNQAPLKNKGVMLLLSDGTVMAKSGNSSNDSTSANWIKLTPDQQGSYLNGTWSLLEPMHHTRLYFSSQVLMDGRVYVAGGEYGTGRSSAEIYDPLKDAWTMLTSPGINVSDANSEILPDGRVLQAIVGNNKTVIYDPKSNTFSAGPTPNKNMNESSWVKLRDNSILFVGMNSFSSLRYIPSSNKWVQDANVPVMLYDPYGSETGAGFLLPNGKAFFIGSTNVTAYYTPSGDSTMGVWEKGPNLPSGLGAPDAAAAMLVNGKILCALSPIADSANHFKKPTIFYEFDYLSNQFKQILAPDENSFMNIPCYVTNMLDLPDGNVLYASQGSMDYYVYRPEGSPLAQGKPVISQIVQTTCDSFFATGTLFNGISEGASYGDDWQMNTNYPIIRLRSGSDVYYLRSYNWNSTGVQRWNLSDTAFFALPKGLPLSSFEIEVVANGNSSDPIPFQYIPCAQIAEKGLLDNNHLFIYPNPSIIQTRLMFKLNESGTFQIRIIDMLGRLVQEETGSGYEGNNSYVLNLRHIARGEYVIILQTGSQLMKSKLIVN